MLTLLRAVAFAVLACAALALHAADKGFFGLSLSVEMAGTPQAPTIKEAKIVKVLSASPAANAGIQRGDVIVEVEGRSVVGGNAYEFDKLMKKQVGESLRMKLKRGDAAPYEVTMTAVVGRPE